MDQGLWRRHRFAVALALIALAGLVSRVAYVWWNRNGIVRGDGFVYHFGALNLVDGIGFYDPKSGAALAGHPPAWEIVLAAPGLLGLRSWLSQQFVSCAVGTATVVMTGLIAAALAAAYPFVWLYERELLSEPLAMLGTATTIWLAYRFRAKPGAWLAVALGVAVGVMAMTRSELLGIAVLLILPLILSARSVRFQRRCVWLGAAMVTGNCPPTFHGKLLGYYEFGCIVFVAGVDTEYSVADGQYRDHALDFLERNKAREPIVVAARVGRVFGVFRPAQQMHLETERATDLWVLQLGFVVYWILVPLAVAGVVLARRRRIAVYPLLAFPLIVLISVIPTIGSVRYRAPAEIALVILASVGIDAVFRAVQARRGRAGPVPPELPEEPAPVAVSSVADAG